MQSMSRPEFPTRQNPEPTLIGYAVFKAQLFIFTKKFSEFVGFEFDASKTSAVSVAPQGQCGDPLPRPEAEFCVLSD